MTFRFSNGLPPVKPVKKSTRNIGLTANLNQLGMASVQGTPCTLTITTTPDENAGSIPATAARVFGKGGYSVKALGETRAGNSQFEVSVR